MTDSIGQQAVANVVSVIQALNLRHLSPNEVAIGQVASDERLIRRGVTITPVQEEIDDSSPAEGTNERDMVCYKFLLTLVVGNPHGWTENLDTIAEWRQRIRREFHCKRALTSVSGTTVNHVICKVTHGQITLTPEYMRNNNASQMMLHCWFLEPRTQET